MRFAEFRSLSDLKQIQNFYELEREDALNKEEFLNILSEACVGIDHEEFFLNYIEVLLKLNTVINSNYESSFFIESNVTLIFSDNNMQYTVSQE